MIGCHFIGSGLRRAWLVGCKGLVFDCGFVVSLSGDSVWLFMGCLIACIDEDDLKNVIRTSILR